MDEFLNQEPQEDNNNTEEEIQSFDSEETTEPIDETPSEQEPLYTSVTFSPITPMNDYKPMKKGLKVFSLVLVVIILLTSTCLVGYFAGKNSVNIYNGKPANVKVELEPIPTDSKAMTAAKIYETVNPSIVGITVYNTAGDGSQASGIVYSENGYIITNDHIYSEVPSAKFKIHTYDGKEYDAKFVAGDQISDLAVLKIENCDLTPAVFGNSNDVYMGQTVVAIGRPNDATDISSITSGIISATNRRVQNSSNYSARLIQTDSPINPGSSGGALVNMYGQVIGVTSSKLANVAYEGVGYAIPTTVMKRIVSELITEGKVVSRAKLGITYVAINSVTAEINKLDHIGLQIQSVSTDSDLYGKVTKGDMITKINDIEVMADNTVLDIIENCSAGDKISVTVITTKNETKTFTVQLSANIGKSSYTTKSQSSGTESQAPGGTFDFPFGE